MYIYDKQSEKIHRNHPKHSNLENRFFRYIRPQKSPKIAKKNDDPITNCSIFWIGMAYFIWYVVNPHDGSEYICQRGVGGHLGQFTPVIFRNNTRFWPMTSFWAAITLKRRLGHLNRLHFLNPKCVRIPWVPLKIFGYRAFYPKNHFFANFRAHTKICSGLVCAQFWCHRPST